MPVLPPRVLDGQCVDPGCEGVGQETEVPRRPSRVRKADELCRALRGGREAPYPGIVVMCVLLRHEFTKSGELAGGGRTG